MGNMLLEVMNSNSVKRYQMDIISTGNLRLFLPTTFYLKEDGEVISYANGEGYIKLKDVPKVDEVTAIDMIGILVDGMRDASNNFIFPEEYRVEEDTVYIDKDMNRVRLLFRPGEDNWNRSGSSLVSYGNKRTPIVGEIMTGYEQISDYAYSDGQRIAPPDADILSCKVGEGAAGPVWEAARLFRADGYGPAAALLELAELRHRVWLKTQEAKQNTDY